MFNFICTMCLIITGLSGCTNTYNRAIRNYSGQLIEYSDYCDVRIVNNELDYKLVKRYLNEHNTYIMDIHIFQLK